jgi:hypothetical protein
MMCSLVRFLFCCRTADTIETYIYISDVDMWTFTTGKS